MMQRAFLCALIVGLLAIAPAAAQKVYIDYDKAFDFSKIKTYAWGKTDANLAESQPRAHAHIVDKIDAYLASKGLQKVEQNPDGMVTYHTNSQQELSVNTASWGYGYPSSFYWNPYWGGAYGSTSTTVTTYKRGTLIVDLWDPAQHELVWRGSASDIVPENPEKAYKLIDKALGKIIDKWQKMKAQAAKAKK